MVSPVSKFSPHYKPRNTGNPVQPLSASDGHIRDCILTQSLNITKLKIEARHKEKRSVRKTDNKMGWQ
jgi:hypothetical protein